MNRTTGVIVLGLAVSGSACNGDGDGAALDASADAAVGTSLVIDATNITNSIGMTVRVSIHGDFPNAPEVGRVCVLVDADPMAFTVPLRVPLGSANGCEAGTPVGLPPGDYHLIAFTVLETDGTGTPIDCSFPTATLPRDTVVALSGLSTCPG